MSHAAARPAALLLAALASGCGGGGFALEVGDCVRTPEGGATDPAGMAEVTIVDCDEPHELEVFHVFELAPDQLTGDALVEAVREECLGDAFTDQVGVPEDRSPLEVLPIPPTAEQVASGDREVVCTLQQPGGGTTTGSLRAGTDGST